MKSSRALPLLGVVPAVVAVPTPAHPMVTAPPTVVQRDLGDYVHSVLGDLGSDVSSFVASGVPQFFNDLPTGTDVMSSAGVSSTDLDALPTQVLNVPGYANWTDQGWNLRVHGNVFKQPDLSQEKVDDLADIFLIGVDIEDLPADQQNQARNLTKEIFVVQQDDETVKIDFVNNVDVEPGKDGGAINAKGGAQNITMPYKTTSQGDFDAFIKLKNTTGSNGGHMMAGNETTHIQTLNYYTRGTDTGNATAWLVPPEGVTIISDIDDILRVTKIYDPKQGLLNSFARAFTPWMNMPEIYANWSKSYQDWHFHYLTTTPEQVTRNYMDFIYKTYPLGSFDTRPLNFSDVSATLAIRKFLLEKVFQTFPKRKFVLVADTSNSDIMKDYPSLYHEYPGQVLCILLRNTSATDSKDLFPYDTSGFEGIPQNHYMFFREPNDLTNLDIAAGQCYNSSIPQNVTFKLQGPFGLGSGAGALLPTSLHGGLAIWLAIAVGLSLAL